MFLSLHFLPLPPGMRGIEKSERSVLKVLKIEKLKNSQPCKEINTLFYHLDIFQGLISPFLIRSVI